MNQGALLSSSLMIWILTVIHYSTLNRIVRRNPFRHYKKQASRLWRNDKKDICSARIAPRIKSGRTHLDVLKRGGFDGITRKKAEEPFVRLLRTLDINVECKVSCCRPRMWLKSCRSGQTRG